MSTRGRSGGISARAWLRALELTAPITRSPERTFPIVVEELAETFGDAPALLTGRACLTYRALAQRSNQYSRWALDQGLARGDAVCLLMSNRPEYMAIWLGITRVGGVAALVNVDLAGPSLAHCIDIVAPRHIIASAELTGRLTNALPASSRAARIWIHGEGRDGLPRIDLEVERHAGGPLSAAERRPPTIEDRALYIYTSGTTGLPKAANVSHFRLMQWSHWFAGIMDTSPTDRMYNCLPMHHSAGGVLAIGAVLVRGGSVVIGEKFAARRFWDDIARWDCTLFQYIGELCRYLLHAEPQPRETAHRIRLCCGNGLRFDVWNAFKARFRIPRILEFYASTEGNVSLFNVEERPGAVGRIPSFLVHRSPAMLVRYDVEKGQPFRDDRGMCVRCVADETGEAIGKLSADPSGAGSRFEGYSSSAESGKKILRDVIQPGDAWFRSGDLMRKDAEGYFYFIDRIGDTFRWKGENVSTTEVSAAICSFPGVKDANVYGVTIPGTDGRAGMAALVTSHDLDFAALRAHLVARLPAYARPLFLRIRRDMHLSASFRHSKHDLVLQGYDPAATADATYFDDPEREAFTPLDRTLYERIRAGRMRL